MVKNPTKRLGAANGVDDVKAHSFFASVDWEKTLAREVVPPFVPEVDPSNPTKNFDDEFTKQRLKDSEMPGARDNMHVAGFTFTPGQPGQMPAPVKPLAVSPPARKSTFFNCFAFCGGVCSRR